jgi:hypothetical protein
MSKHRGQAPNQFADRMASLKTQRNAARRSGEPDRRTPESRTATVNTSSDSTKANLTIRVHIIDVVEEKDGGYTLVVQPHSGSEIISDEIWRVALPGDYRGATRVDRLWHLYYGRDPGYSPGAWLDLAMPEPVGERDKS